MPELPEIEAVRARISPATIGKEVAAILTSDQRLLRTGDLMDFRDHLEGSRVEEIRRIGKYLLFGFDSDYLLVSHLRMTGNWIVGDPETARYSRAIIRFTDGDSISYCDIRRFGTWDLIREDAVEAFVEQKRLGPDPFSSDFAPKFAAAVMSRRSAAIKTLLLDQRVACGVGNIYADEALHRAKINPKIVARTISRQRIVRLAGAITDVLRESVLAQRGTYSTAGVYGGGKRGLLVYGRAGDVCASCRNGRITVCQVAGRSCSYCPQCQRNR